MELLCGLTPANMEISRVVLRLLLDEQAMATSINVDKKSPREAMEAVLLPSVAGGGAGGVGSIGLGAGGAGAADGRGGAGAGMEAQPGEKALCDCVLATLAEKPGGAPLYAQLLWQVGPRVGQWLLRTVTWVLDDRPGDHITGAAPLAATLARRRRTPLTGAPAAAGAAAVAGGTGRGGGVHPSSKGGVPHSSHGTTINHTVTNTNASRGAAAPTLPPPGPPQLPPTPGGQGGGGGLEPFAVEAGLAAVALVGLSNAKSNIKAVAGECGKGVCDSRTCTSAMSIESACNATIASLPLRAYRPSCVNCGVQTCNCCVCS